MLDEIERRRDSAGLRPSEWTEMGLLLDRMGRFDDAFFAFQEGKRARCAS
jgi:hypothetical protein